MTQDTLNQKTEDIGIARRQCASAYRDDIASSQDSGTRGAAPRQQHSLSTGSALAIATSAQDLIHEARWARKGLLDFLKGEGSISGAPQHRSERLSEAPERQPRPAIWTSAR